MGEADAGVYQGGGICLDLGPDILGSGSVGPFVRVRNVGDETVNWEGVGQIPPQGDPQDERGGK